MHQVLLIAEAAADRDKVCRGLAEADHEVVGVIDYSDCTREVLERHIRAAQEPVIVVTCASPATAFLDDLFEAMGEPLLPVVIFATDDSSETIEAAIHAGVAAYEVDGLNTQRVASIIKVAVARFDLMEQLRGELNMTRRKLDDRKYVERAKGLLMQSRGLSEEEAYHTLRRMAMERNKRLGDVARSVVDMAALFDS